MAKKRTLKVPELPKDFWRKLDKLIETRSPARSGHIEVEGERICRLVIVPSSSPSCGL